VCGGFGRRAGSSAPDDDGLDVGLSQHRLAMPSFNYTAAIRPFPGRNCAPDALGVNLAEWTFASVPGLLARNRNNYAQDQQISIRGFGANSTFGIRGVRRVFRTVSRYRPDGQGQVSQFNLDSAGRVEILRGRFLRAVWQFLGAVIQIFTADGADRRGCAPGWFTEALEPCARAPTLRAPRARSPTTSTSRISPSRFAATPQAAPRAIPSTQGGLRTQRCEPPDFRG